MLKDARYRSVHRKRGSAEGKVIGTPYTGMKQGGTNTAAFIGSENPARLCFMYDISSHGKRRT
jgi:hypothetical protein